MSKYAPLVRACSLTSASLAAIRFGSLPSTPFSCIGLSLLPSLSFCTLLSNRSQSLLNRAISSLFPSTARNTSSNRLREVCLLRIKERRSLSNPAIFFSNFAFSNKSVFPERMATYSEKFIPDFSSMLPSSMVRLPRRLFFSCSMNNCLLYSRLNL